MNPNIPGAIRKAVEEGEVDAVRSWLAAGGDAFVNDLVTTVDGHSQLLFLATTSRTNRGPAMVQLLLDFGARPAVINVIKAIGNDDMRDYRASGKDWKRYVAEPRKQLLVLRRLVERGRARPPRGGWTSLARTLIGREPSDDGAKAVHDLFGRKDLPDVLFWKVLAFWRSDRDV
jgi:hypothetical protein